MAKLLDLEQELTAQIYPLRTEFHQLHEQSRALIKLISASRWPHVRRYATFVQDIDHKIDSLISHTEQYISAGSEMSTKLGLKSIVKHEMFDDIPPPRPLSELYPTFKSLAGTSKNQKLMEDVNELGQQIFLLNNGQVLTFLSYCTLDHFCSIEIYLATYSRINTCQLRIIIRVANIETPLRILYIEGIDILDNCFHVIRFEPIVDSAGKTYQIEIDSPDATEESAIAVWCYTKKTSQDPKTDVSLLQQRPLWLQQDMLACPISEKLTSKAAPHQFMLYGITKLTSVFSVHLFLLHLGKALKQANSEGGVILCGSTNPELQDYCQQHHLTILPYKPFNFTIETESEYLWCCDLAALPQSDIVVRALEIFVDHPKVGVLVPMEKYKNGTICAGYTSIMPDGFVKSLETGMPCDHPYHGYRRTVTAANSQLLIIKTACLSQLNIKEIHTYHTVPYKVTELLWQLKAQEYEALYEAALCYQQTQDYPVWKEQDYQKDRQYFYQRWCELLKSNTSSMLLQLPTVLIIDHTLPTYDEDSGSLRIYTLMKIWVSLGYRITFFPDNLDGQFKYRHALEALGIEVFHDQYGIADVMTSRPFDFAFICRVDIGAHYIPMVRSLSPKTIIFYDTVDIHYIRELRQAEIENNPTLAASALITKRKELSNCLLADRVITVTTDDTHHLQQDLPNVNYSVIPNIHPQHPLSDSGFEERDGLVFIGNYNHQPNEDAVYYFIEHVLPKIHERLPKVHLYIIGSHIKDKMLALANDVINMVGWVDTVEPAFAQRRVFVSYLRYGAGMKGKLGQALSLGLPVVSTTIGAEGMGLQEEETALIADTPDQFADAVCRLYTDSVLWKKLSVQGQAYIEHEYGESAVREKLQEILGKYSRD